MKELNFWAHIVEELRKPTTRVLVGSIGSG